MAVNIQGITNLYDGLSNTISAKLDELYTANKIDAETYSKLVTQALSSIMQVAIDTYQKQETIDISNSKLGAEIIKIDADTEMTNTQKIELIAKGLKDRELLDSQIIKIDADTEMTNIQKIELIAKGLKDRELLDSQISLTSRQEYKIMSDISNQNLITDADLTIKAQQEFSEKIKNGDVSITVTYTPDYVELDAQGLLSGVTNDSERLAIVSPKALHLAKQASTSDGATSIEGYYYYYYDGGTWEPIQDATFVGYPGLKNVVQVTYGDGQSLSLYNAQINDTVSQTTTRNIKVADDLISTETQRDVAAEDGNLKATQATVLLKEQGNKDHLTAVEAELKTAQVGVVEADEALKLAQADGVGRDIIIKEIANRKDSEVKDAQKAVAYRDAIIKERQQELLANQTKYEAAKTDVLNSTRIDNLLIKDAEILNNSIQGYSTGGLVPPTGLLSASSNITTRIADRAGLALATYSNVYTYRYTDNLTQVVGDKETVYLDDDTYKEGGSNAAKGQYGQRYLNVKNAQANITLTANFNFATTAAFLALD